MGKKPRLRPERLAEKLLQIRNALGLSQSGMYRRLGVEEIIDAKRISDYETEKNEPPLLILLQYGRVAGVHVEDLIDDEADLPVRLPGKVKHERFKPIAPLRRRKKR